MAEEEGKYIYCLIGANEERTFGPIGIGGRGDEVYTVCYRDLAAVISTTETMKYPVDRPNVMAHQKVMEEVMKNHVILPVRFDTIAEHKKKKGKVIETHEERIKRQVLQKRYKEFEDLLAYMSNKTELGVRGLWTDRDKILGEIVTENQQIAILNKQILKRPPTRTQAERVRLGEMVINALVEKKDKEEEKVVKVLKKIAVDFRQNKKTGDKMFMNDAFLVEREREKELSDALEELNKSYDDRWKIKYIGPVPPCNFVEIVVTWEED